MKKKIVSFFLCMVLLLAIASTTATAAVPAEHDIAEGNIILETCGDECPGHIITGTAVETTYNIQILSGEHKLILKELNLERIFGEQPAAGIDPDKPDMLKELSAIFIDSKVEKVEFSIVGDVKIASELGISGVGTEISLQGDDDSFLDIYARYGGLYAADITMEGGKYSFVTDSVKGPETHCGIYSFGSVKIKDADVTACAGDCSAKNPYFMISVGIYTTDMTVENSTVKASGGNIDKQQGDSFGIQLDEYSEGTLKATNSDIIVASGDAADSYGIYGFNMELEDSSITAESSTARTESVGASLYGEINMKDSDMILSAGESDYSSIGLKCVGRFTAENSYIYSCGDEAAVGIGICVWDSVFGTNSEIIGIGGVATATSIGITADSITANGGIIRGIADECEENGFSYGIFIEQQLNKPFIELINANVVASGYTQSVHSLSNNFIGISYKADENAEPVNVEDLTAKEIFFGNKYKVIYNANGRNIQVPEPEEYYYGEDFLISEAVPAVEDYEFICWNTKADGSGDSYYPGDSFNMGNMDAEFYSIWKCLSGVDTNGDGKADKYVDPINVKDGIYTDPDTGDMYKDITEPKDGILELVVPVDTNGDGKADKYVDPINVKDGIYTDPETGDMYKDISEPKDGILELVVPVDTNGDDANKDQQATNSPQTGDNSNIGSWLTLLIAGATVIVILSVDQKKRKAMK